MSFNNNEIALYKEKRQMLQKGKSKFGEILKNSQYFDVNRLLTVMESEFKKNPKLLQCSNESIGGAVLLAARLGLEPDEQLGHFYLIPYGKTAQVIIGYKGLLELALRSGKIKGIYAHEVYDGDFFEVDLGTDKRIIHKPDFMSKGKRELVAVYAVAEYTSGAKEVEVMSRYQIDEVRAQSKSKDSGPWRTHYSEMARKTVLRRICKYIPSSVEAQKVSDNEEDLSKTYVDSDEFWKDADTIDTTTGEIFVDSEGEKMQNGNALLTQKLKQNGSKTEQSTV